MGNYSLLVHIKPRRIFILVFDYGSKGGIAKALTPPLYYRTLGAFQKQNRVSRSSVKPTHSCIQGLE